MKQSRSNPDISILLPCLNEEKALASCLSEIQETLARYALNAEVIVIDNGSSDRSPAIAREKALGMPELVILEEQRKGYGSAYLKGFAEAKGRYIFMADADCSYDFKDIPRFIDKLRGGSDLVVGDRFARKMEKGSMPWLHRYLGNPLLSFIMRRFFRVKVRDIHCGMRAMTKSAFDAIRLHTTGMEFASEMILKAARKGLIIDELPISYRPRIGESKLKSIRDGWRHMRLLLLYSPLYLFLVPGVTIFCIGLISLIALYFYSPRIFDLQFYVHPMFLSSLLLITGYQIIFFLGFSKIYSINHLGEESTVLERMFRVVSIEKAGFAGIIITLIGASIYIYIFYTWVSTGFGSLDEIKNSIVALTFIILGIQTFFSSFMLSILSIKDR